MLSKPLRFMLPPSYTSLARERRAQLEQFIAAATGEQVEVSVGANYDAIATSLLSGEARAAWAPPWACARLETAGVPILARAVRAGQTTYRAALVARRDSAVEFESLKGRRAAWVDHESTGGYLLVAAHLRSRGHELDRTFSSQQFLGSYQQALAAVASGDADVTSVYSPPANVAEAPDFEDLLPGKAHLFRVIAFTDEAPNDGVALAPFSPPALAKAIEHALLHAPELALGPEVLAGIFHADRFEPAPKNSYRALYQAVRLLR